VKFLGGTFANHGQPKKKYFPTVGEAKVVLCQFLNTR
jgi:hypothetical protein